MKVESGIRLSLVRPKTCCFTGSHLHLIHGLHRNPAIGSALKLKFQSLHGEVPGSNSIHTQPKQNCRNDHKAKHHRHWQILSLSFWKTFPKDILSSLQVSSASTCISLFDSHLLCACMCFLAFLFSRQKKCRFGSLRASLYRDQCQVPRQPIWQQTWTQLNHTFLTQPPGGETWLWNWKHELHIEKVQQDMSLLVCSLEHYSCCMLLAENAQKLQKHVKNLPKPLYIWPRKNISPIFVTCIWHHWYHWSRLNMCI